MEKRPYFVLGDLVSSCVTGGLTAWVVYHSVPSKGSMILAMAAGMVVGMVMGMLLTFVFMPFFGAMEVMLPVMLAGKLSGMVVGMGLAMHGWSEWWSGLIGVLCGLVAFVWTLLAHYRVQGVTGHDGYQNPG
ncbi:MAG: hypothetical protein HQL74_06285 [Magnetococcales bacterium]|nr:hypothetical protein [Magnetococcales bacterium]